MFGGEDPSHTVTRVRIRSGDQARRNCCGYLGPPASRGASAQSDGIGALCEQTLASTPEENRADIWESEERLLLLVAIFGLLSRYLQAPSCSWGRWLRSLSLCHATTSSVLFHPLCHPAQEGRTALPRLSGSCKPVAFLHGFSS